MPDREGPVLVTERKQCIGCRHYFANTCFHVLALNRRPPINRNHRTPPWCPLLPKGQSE